MFVNLPLSGVICQVQNLAAPRFMAVDRIEELFLFLGANDRLIFTLIY